MAADKQNWAQLARETASLVPDVVLLFKDVSSDPRVPRSSKLKVAGALAYLVSPIDFVSDFIPGVGMLDDVAIVAFAARELLESAGEEVVREHWRGTERGLELVMSLVEADLRPRSLLRRLVTDRLVGATRRGRPRERIIEGELMRERTSAGSGR
jgi:uncharacterized membrane protein YkvA (DUF1232 family)